MSGEYVNLLKHRSKIFRREAERLLEEKEYDLALFFLEQSAQLALKSIIYKLFGEKPRVHGLRRLPSILAQNLDEAGEKRLSKRVINFVESNRRTLILLEDAYIGARYGYLVAGRREVEEALKVVDELLEILDSIG